MHALRGTEPPSRGAVVASVLAFTKIKCAAAQKWLVPPPCADELDCDGGLCSASDLARDLATWARADTRTEGLEAGRRPVPALPLTRERALLAYAYAQGPLDREITLRNARRHYVWAESVETMDCDEPDAAHGAPCACRPRDLTSIFCAIDGGSTRAWDGTCSFRIDDAKKQIDDVRRK